VKIYQEIEPSESLSDRDINFMRKLGFAKGFIEFAKTNGCFRLGDITIDWNMAWTTNSDFFFEITRNSFPIGRDAQKNYIYISDITSESSKVGLLNSKTSQYVTISTSLKEFFKNSKMILPYKFPIVKDSQMSFSEGDQVKINIHNSDVGEVVCFLPFGSNTRGKITRRSGEYIAVYRSHASSKRYVIIRDRVAWIGLITFSVAYFLICAKLEVKFATQMLIYFVILFGLSPVIMFWSKLIGNWHRL